MWKTAWNMSDELIEKAAEKAKGSPSPVSYMNTLLSSWFKAGVKTPEQADNYRFPDHSEPAKITKTYTSGQLNALFDNLDYEDL